MIRFFLIKILSTENVTASISPLCYRSSRLYRSNSTNGNRMTTPPVPFPCSFWAIPNRLLAGNYPCTRDHKGAAPRSPPWSMPAFVTASTCMEPDERGRTGQPFAPDTDLLASLTAKIGVLVSFDHLPTKTCRCRRNASWQES